MPWWGWALIGWTGSSFVLAPLLGLALREADRSDRVPAGEYAGGVARRPRRRRIPVPPVAFALLVTGAVLETVGFVVRASGNERGAALLWSMDHPLSLPRMFVAALFTAAAFAAAVGALRGTGRRSWWGGVAVVTAAIAQVKAGGNVHTWALGAVGVQDRPVLAVLGSAVVVCVVLAGLWWLSRTERRDRRRMLIALGLYAVAAVGLSGVSSLVGQAGGSLYWQSAATFVEETGEAFGGVAVLVAVLVGVAPRLVLPAEWLLRRRADAATVDAPGALPHRSAQVPDGPS